MFWLAPTYTESMDTLNILYFPFVAEVKEDTKANLLLVFSYDKYNIPRDLFQYLSSDGSLLKLY